MNLPFFATKLPPITVSNPSTLQLDILFAERVCGLYVCPPSLPPQRPTCLTHADHKAKLFRNVLPLLAVADRDREGVIALLKTKGVTVL